MKRFAVIPGLLLIAMPLVAQRRPMMFEDLAAVRRVGAPKLSPDGKWISYDLSTIDLEANLRRSAIFLIPSGGGQPRQITDGTAQDEEPAWSPDGKTIAYVSNREGGPKQIYLYDVASQSSRKASDLLHGAGTIRWIPDGSGLVLVSDVDPDCGVDPECGKQKQQFEEGTKVKARVIDSLMFRHWNAWQGSTRSHILLQPLEGQPRDLTPGKFDAPPFAVGGSDAFDVSPDSAELVYATRTDPDAAISTNSDLFIVPVSGGAPRQITSR